MSNEMSPYDELVLKVKKLEEYINTQCKLNEEIIEIIKHDGKIIKEIISQIELIQRRLSPENPGDINTLYQNWDKH